MPCSCKLVSQQRTPCLEHTGKLASSHLTASSAEQAVWLGMQVGSLQEMDAKLDSMAQSGALDPALLLTIGKAHTSVKDTDYTREEVKDVMAHLYFKVSLQLHMQQS